LNAPCHSKSKATAKPWLNGVSKKKSRPLASARSAKAKATATATAKENDQMNQMVE